MLPGSNALLPSLDDLPRWCHTSCRATLSHQGMLKGPAHPFRTVTLFIPEDLALSRFRSEVGLSPIAFLQSATTAVSVIAYAEVPSQMLRTSEPSVTC